ncbi:MAG TPA: D-alanine--D-alanine ligase family protein [Acidobacteriota bacterium]|nr:D-alanine--D-alanine ligase family protein [Acidobacteriota bacterium]
MKNLRIALLYGGKSGEHEISIRSARSIHAVLRKTHSVFPIFIDKQGFWWRGDEKSETLANAKQDMQERVSVYPGFETPALHTSKARLQIDIAFPVLHGTFGEDGIIQGLLESAGIPYVGAGVSASAAGMDKTIMKALFVQNDLPVAPYLWFYRNDWKNSQENCVQKIEKALKYPVFTKPANLGSSVGISKAHNRQELTAAIQDAARYDSKIVVEQGVDAREIECSVLGNEEAKASLPGEIAPKREFYDYVAKYIEDSTELFVPAKLSDEQISSIQDLSIRAFHAIGCSGMGRVDLFLERGTGKFYLNEINTIPGFTNISMYPKLWEVSGLSFADLLNRLLELGLERHRDQASNETSFGLIENP